MFSLHSFSNPEYDPEVLQKLVQRMVRARWIERALVTPDPISIEWSSKGHNRMAAIVKAVRKYAPGLFDGTPKRLGTIKYLNYRGN